MYNVKLAKLRMQQERAKREYDAAEDLAYQKRIAWERVWLDYLDEAERAGLCRFCLKPANEGSHTGRDHVGVGMAGPVYSDEVMLS